MVQVLISAVSASIKRVSEPVIIEGKTLLRSVSLQTRTSREPIDGGNKLLGGISVSSSPYVLPGKTPDNIKDMDVKIAHIW